MSIEQLVETARRAYRENKRLVPTSGRWLGMNDAGDTTCCAIGAAYCHAGRPSKPFDSFVAWARREFELTTQEVDAFTDGFDRDARDKGNFSAIELRAWQAGYDLAEELGAVDG